MPEFSRLMEITWGVLSLRHSWDRKIPFRTLRQPHLKIRVFKKLFKEGILYVFIPMPQHRISTYRKWGQTYNLDWHWLVIEKKKVYFSVAVGTKSERSGHQARPLNNVPYLISPYLIKPLLFSWVDHIHFPLHECSCWSLHLCARPFPKLFLLFLSCLESLIFKPNVRANSGQKKTTQFVLWVSYFFQFISVKT